MNDWKLYIFDGSNPVPGLEEYWNNTYTNWNSVWTEAFRELNGQEFLHSDEFTRQPNVLSLTSGGGQCLMSVFFREVDLKYQSANQDSYFEIWPEDCLLALQKYSSKVVVCSYTTVAPAVRGLYEGISMKYLLMAFACEYAKSSQCSSVTATTRNDRGMDKAVRASGARLLKKGLLRHGVSVDLMGWFGRELGDYQHEYQDLIDSLWSNRWDHRYPETQRKIKVA